MNQLYFVFLIFPLLQQTAHGFARQAVTKVNLSRQLRHRALTSLNANRNDKTKENAFLGFTDKAEKLNGRIAMTFFALGIYEETITGKSILEQIGFTDHTQQIRGLAVAAFFGLLALFPSFRKLGVKLTSAESINDRS